MSQQAGIRWKRFLPLLFMGGALVLIDWSQPRIDPTLLLPRVVYGVLLWLGAGLIALAVAISVTGFQWKTFVPLFSIGGALALIYRHQPDIDPDLALPRAFYVVLLWLGVALIAAAIVLSVTSIASRGVLLVWRKAVLSWIEPPRYKCRVVRAHELERMQEYWERFFPGDMSDLAQAQAWHRKNGKLSWFLLEVATRGGKRHPEPKLVGSFSIIPLTKRAAEQVAREELVGANLSVDHIAKPSTTMPAAVYIGGLLADGMFAKAELLARVSEKVEKLQNRRIPIYSRPVTPDGLRLVEKYEFQPVIPGKIGLKHVYRLRHDDDEDGEN